MNWGSQSEITLSKSPKRRKTLWKKRESLSGDRSLGRAQNHPLSKPMVYHDQERIKARGNGEVRDEITGNLLKGTGGKRFDG